MRQLLLVAGLTAWGQAATAQSDSTVRKVEIAGDSVIIKFVDADLRGVVQLLSRHLPKPLLSTGVPGDRVTLDFPGAVPRRNILPILQGLAEAHGLILAEEPSHYRLGPKSASGSPLPSPTREHDVQLFVIRLKHARAADIAATINSLFGSGGQYSGKPGLSGGTLSEELHQSGVPTAADRRVMGESVTARPAVLAGPTTLVPDELTNALLVRALPQDFELLKSAIQQLDIRPLQVLIEVLIVEARRDKSFSLGTALTTQSTGGGHTFEGQLTGAGAGDIVLRFLHMGRREIDAVLAIAQSKGQVDIISRPVLLASNNVEARFLVGSQRPFVQVSRSLPTDNASRDQVVQYKDVGTKLTVRPTINEDGYVSLLIQQEISAATAETQFDAPVISTREARTQILVRDSQTVVIGGLTDDQRTRSSSGVPILSGIPIIGGLFGRTSRNRSVTELFLFLTPRIIRTDADADRLTATRLPPPSDTTRNDRRY